MFFISKFFKLRMNMCGVLQNHLYIIYILTWEVKLKKKEKKIDAFYVFPIIKYFLNNILCD